MSRPTTPCFPLGLRRGRKSLRVDFTLEDPKAYTRPITSTMLFKLKADWPPLKHRDFLRGP